MRVVFMGTPGFAVTSFQRIRESSHRVVGVVTQPDRPAGRGLRMASSPVKEEAVCADIPIFQSEDLKSKEFLRKLNDWSADCFVVVGFTILPSVVYEMPPMGAFNLHASLLPKYRGAAPIQWALMNGETQTGVTTFFLQKRVDTGDLILQEATAIGDLETAGELHDRLADMGAGLVVRTLDLIESGETVPRPQSGASCPAPKITKAHRIIDWARPAKDIVNQIRGLSPVPCASTRWHGKGLKVFRAGHSEASRTAEAGTIVNISSDHIQVTASEGSVLLFDVQLEGKKRMRMDAFLRGTRIEPGMRLGA